MGKAKLFISGCCNTLTDKQRLSIRQLCLSDDVLDSSACRKEVNNCGEGLDKILENTPFFPLRGIGFNVERLDWEEVPVVNSIPFIRGERVIKIEDGGYALVVYKAREDFQCVPSLFIPSQWEEVCGTRLVKQFILPSTNLLTNSYVTYLLENPSTLSDEYYYLVGDVVINSEVDECTDNLCCYVCRQNMPINEEVYEQYRYLPLHLNPYFDRVICSNSDLSKCLGPNRQKTPEEGYEWVRIGSKDHYVEAPIPFAISPSREELNVQSNKESPVVLSQRDIDILDGLIPPECL